MTREEARQGLQGYSLLIADGTDLKEALNIAIDALQTDDTVIIQTADRPTEEGNFNKCHGCKHEKIRWRMLSGSHDREPCIWCSRTLLDRYERNEE